MDDIEARYVLVPSTGEAGTELADRVVVGRMNTCDIAIQDKSVSREHARLSRLGTGYLLEDLNSTNGTLVNGNRISEATVVQPGDLLTFGTVEFRLDPLGVPDGPDAPDVTEPPLEQQGSPSLSETTPESDQDMFGTAAPVGLAGSAPTTRPAEAPPQLFEGGSQEAGPGPNAHESDALANEIIALTARLSDLVVRLRDRASEESSRVAATGSHDDSTTAIRDIIDSVPASPMTPDELQEARDVLAGLTTNPKDFDLLMRARAMAPQLTRMVDQYSQVEAVLNAVADAVERSSPG